jgi:N-acetylglucosamine-6-phosphate deacetylase
MILLSGARVVLADRVVDAATLVIDGDAIADVVEGVRRGGDGDTTVGLPGLTLVPGFIDVHVHGVEGHDTLDPGAPVGSIARRLPKYGVTAFCPTTVACAPDALAAVCRAIRQVRERPPGGAARVLPAHLESNFISPDFRGAQPLECLRLPPGAGGGLLDVQNGAAPGEVLAFTGADILATITAWRDEVGIVTLAPEMDQALPLIRDLTAGGHLVSLGHSGASLDAANAGIDAGARQVTHLFNRMPPLHHREPGLIGAALVRDEVAVEVICDGYHVHPTAIRAAVAAKTTARIMAITDGTAGSGLPVGARASLGGRRITVRETAAFLDRGTLAGSVLTMDGAFRQLVQTMGFSLADAAVMCATTPARQLGLTRQGRLEPGMLADLVVLDDALRVVQTWVAGRQVFGDEPAHAD